MRLTAQQISEFRSIQISITDYASILRTPEPEKSRKLKLLEHEFNSYKVKMENMIIDTDIKNEKIDILRGLLKVGNLLLSAPSYRPMNAVNDYGRHTEMALKIAPKNPAFNSRNQNDPE